MPNRRAQLFAIDLLLAFIPLTIMLGMSANALSGMAFQVQDYANIYSLQRKTNDAADILIKSPGTPPNWNSSINPTVSGLAYYDNTTDKTFTNRIYFLKINALNESDLATLTGTTNNYLNISVIELSLSYTWGNNPSENAKDIAVAERYSGLQFSSDFGVFLDAIGVTKTGTPVDPVCESMVGPGTGGCAYDNITGVDTSNGDFYLYVDSTGAASGEVVVGNGASNLTFFSGTDFDFCTHYKQCDNTDEADCKLSGPDPPYTIYSNFIFTLTDGTTYTPTSDNPLTSATGYSNCNDVSKATAVVPLPTGFIQNIDELGVRSTAASNDPLDVYGIKVPIGMPWQFVTPDAFPATLYPAKLTLKVWT